MINSIRDFPKSQFSISARSDLALDTGISGPRSPEQLGAFPSEPEFHIGLVRDDCAGLSYLGARNPVVMLAEQIKKLREDWKGVAGGRSRLKVGTFSSEDRKDEAIARKECIETVNLEDDVRDS
ncbi:hypothetical protein [Rhizobium sp. PAMB 3182]